MYMAKRRLNLKYRRIINIIVLIIALICLTLVIYSIINIVNWKINVDDNKNIQNKINDNITIVEPTEEKEAEYNIDFKALKEINEDTIAYLKVNGTNIDYVVVKGNDNSYYLKHNFEKNLNIAGWIFADYHNNFDELDKNIVIFGHNTKDGSMFGTLKNVLNKEWYENKDNYKIILVTEMTIYYYQVFSTYSIKAEDYYINTEFVNNEEFKKFINKLKSRSIYNYEIEVSGNDKILTLSSCIGDGSKRVVLHAKLLTNEDYNL
ncbi:MAG: class B sortase [Bacilli bacterium]|nr:class B sortase [Bacilli bacterium]